jgi:hypothetical protein
MDWSEATLRGLAREAWQELGNHDSATGTLALRAKAAGCEISIPEAGRYINEARERTTVESFGAAASALVWRTLADIDDVSPGPLLLDMLESDAPNMLYGAGGVGKGSTCAWIIAELDKLGMRTLVYDAEGHPREWRRRTAGLGVSPERVVYVEPSDLPPALLGKPLEYVVPHLGEIAHRAECGNMVVDSVLAAANLSVEGLRADAGAPYRYAAKLAEIDITSISIAHTTKGAPDGDPYGSVSWTNAMRLTWLGTRAEGDDHRVRWTPRKRNERGHIRSVLLSFHYDETDQLCGVRREDDEQVTRDWLTTALMEGPRTVEDLAEDMVDMDGSGQPHATALGRAKDRIRQTLGRMRSAGQVHKVGGRGTPWALGCPPRVSRNGSRDGARAEAQ